MCFLLIRLKILLIWSLRKFFFQWQKKKKKIENKSHFKIKKIDVEIKEKKKNFYHKIFW